MRVAEQRLRDHEVCWLTTVTSEGQPQTSPVGYVWAGGGFVAACEGSDGRCARV